MYRLYNSLCSTVISCKDNLFFYTYWFFLIEDNVSSISGVHYRDEAKLCNKYHITNRADWD